MAEWNYEKNGDLNPLELMAFSNRKVWWKCEKGHEWEATISSRTAGNGCPYCAGTKVWKGFNDLATLNPELAKEWHPTRNGTMTPDTISAGTHMKAWWVCEKGHEWQASIASRATGRGCPYCKGRKAWKGFNDLATVNPELAKEWHPEKNNNLTPFDVTAGSDKKIWWRCKHGHEWQATISSRVRGNGCPYCSGKVAISGYNDLATLNPELAKEWHPTKNSLPPTAYLPLSNKIVWWKCEKGHEWRAAIYSRTAGRGCPYCAGTKVWKGFNDLATVNPELAKEWHPTKNKKTPFEVSSGSEEKIWWKCEKGHEWKAPVYSRTAGNGCPYCSGVKVLNGFNDLATLNPELAKEWHPTKNRKTPSDVTLGSNEAVWWLCQTCGHEWKISTNSRAGVKKSGCPRCAAQFKTSFAEQAIYYYLREIFPDTKNREIVNKNEIDIYIPSRKIGIEYDGAWYHKSEITKRREERKNTNLKKLGIRLFRIKEVKNSNRGVWNENDVFYYSVDNVSQYLNEIILKVIMNIYPDISMDVSVDRDRMKILELYKLERFENSLTQKHPDLAKEWHPTKNGKLTPDMFTPGSQEKVWWVCKYGHEWKAKISHRCSGSGCPTCANRRVEAGFNDLASINKKLTEEWNFEKNMPLLPSQVTAGSGRKVWWKCTVCGHEWQAYVCDRNRGMGCPECAKERRKQSLREKNMKIKE